MRELFVEKLLILGLKRKTKKFFMHLQPHPNQNLTPNEWADIFGRGSIFDLSIPAVPGVYVVKLCLGSFQNARSNI